MTNAKQAQRARELLEELPEGVLDKDFEESANYKMFVHECGSIGMDINGPSGCVSLDEKEMRELVRVIKKFLGLK